MTKQPPHDIEAERAVLGACLLNADAIFAVAETLKPDDFHAEGHQHIFKAMLDISESKPGDIVLLCDQLRGQDQLEDLGGAAYLGGLSDAVQTSANAPLYADLVRQKALLRDIIAAASQIAAGAYTARDAGAYAFESASRLQEVLSSQTKGAVTTPTDLMPGHREWLSTMSNGDAPLGMKLGIAELDAFLHYGIRDELIIVAGRPSTGKTSFLLSVADHVANHYGPVFIASAESKTAHLMRRLNAIVCPVAEFDECIPRGRVSRGELMKGYMAALEKRQFYFKDNTSDIDEILYAVRAHLHRVPQTKLFVLDYFQRLTCANKRTDERQEYNKVLKRIDRFRKTVDVPILMASQIGREQFSDDYGPPLSSLKDTGNQEQDADIVILLWVTRADQAVAAQAGNRREIVLQARIAKQRDGPVGKVPGGLILKKVQTLVVSKQGRENELNQQNDLPNWRGD